MKSLLRTSILSCLCIVLLACENDKASMPVVEISFPPEDYRIRVPDTINIRGKVSDETGVNFFKVQLVNDQLLNPFLLFSTDMNNKRSYTFDFSSVVYDYEIPTGNYYIKATAYNKEHVASDFVSVYVNEAPLKLEKIVICSREASGMLSVKALDPSLNREHILDYEGTFVASAINSSGKQLFIALNEPSITHSLDLSDGLPGWTEQAHQPYPFFNDLILHEYIIYLASENGEIYGMDINHNPKFNIMSDTDTVPEKIIVFNNFMISDSRKRVGGSHQLMVYYKESGAFIQRKAIQGSILDFYALNQEQLICFSNPEKGKSMIYNPASNTLSGEYHFGFNIRHTARIDDTRFLLATNETVYLYNVNESSNHPVISQSGIEALAYEPLQQHILLAANNRIYILDYPSYEVVEELEWSSKVEKIDFLYNKNPGL